MDNPMVAWIVIGIGAPQALHSPPHGVILDALDAFLQEHRRCGMLDAGASVGVVWMTCECGASMARRLA